MIKIEQIYIDGTRVQGIIIESPGGTGHPNMIIIQCRNGYLMCGYLNLDAAERFGDAAVVVSGADFDDILSAPTPLYVCKIDPIHNTVMLGSNEDLYQTMLTAADFNWISGKVPTALLSCKAKIRYRQPEQQATATANGDGTVAAVFDTPQRAITLGQAVVLYDDDTVLGGGVIQMD